MSEGWLLWELMRILRYRKRTRFIKTRGKNHFLNELNRASERYLHIATHGRFSKRRGTYLVTPRGGRVYVDNLQDLWKDRNRSEIPELVVLSACHAGHADMVKAFSNAGCRYCIAPLHETLWEDAANFLVVFYKLLIGEGFTPWISYKNAFAGLSIALPKLSGAWRFYDWGEKCIP